ncbi:tryptophan synthase subunit alpha [Halomonas sp. MCCC 1A17488]|uniref:tryptophan synthase subunit alpha n=1 Tax=unclassified Halomonas TaxID=2609666 RepID=UPI0018D24B45|nr:MULTISPECIES: tryptophan synthase subunit alpha [unclassified Halomonas]MCE8016497.1 tryptophan synthase subunit alpha [Halomonas sp. MCCC 1A17488]MCG3239830.1 tryptophan synthase subunit alpha [Halomonas sp. MCCC 1A17488]QPP50270.1 tryptophan synthase subunit alpha [Halomonas sp. SS10-MC5]
MNAAKENPVNAATRLDACFTALKAEQRPALVTYVTAGDPDFETSLEILQGLPAAGADVIEIGMPFSDPMADGPTIQKAALRALEGGQTMTRTLELVHAFRQRDSQTPLVLMGYYNPIHRYGVARFLADAARAGVDGLIVVDLPPEHDDELCLPAREHGIAYIRLATPTTDAKRLPRVLDNTSGFLYCVSVNGITGGSAPPLQDVERMVGRLREQSHLPIAVGFGIRTAAQAQAIGRFSDAVVVGSALVEGIESAGTRRGAVEAVHGLVRDLAAGVRRAANA